MILIMLLVLVASLVCFWAISHPPLAVMKEPIPVSINSTGPGIRISLGSVPSKDIQDHPLAVEKNGTLRGHYSHNSSFDLEQQHEKPAPSTIAGEEKNSDMIPGSPGALKICIFSWSPLNILILMGLV